MEITLQPAGIRAVLYTIIAIAIFFIFLINWPFVLLGLLTLFFGAFVIAGAIVMAYQIGVELDEDRKLKDKEKRG